MAFLAADVPQDVIDQLDQVAAELARLNDEKRPNRSILVRRALRHALATGLFLPARLSDDTTDARESRTAA